jgi:hypothetical protein
VKEKLENISDFLDVINEIATAYEKDTKKEFGIKDTHEGPSWYKYQHNLWFRGQADYSWPLLPQVCREKFQKAAARSGDSVVGYEKTAFNQFITRANHLIVNKMSISERYFLAQHYGLPTRLLDWTTNPLTALFFGVANKSLEKSDGAFIVYLSRKDISGFEHESVLYNHRDKNQIELLIKEVLYENPKKDKFKYPVRIIPNNQAGRIFSQSSRFTLHLESSKEYDELFGNVVFKLRIPHNVKNKILRELSLLNISRSTLFMGMENIVADIKEEMISKDDN